MQDTKDDKHNLELKVTETYDAPVSRQIWSAWHQGRSAAPATVRMIFDRWEELNPDASFHVVEREEGSELISAEGIDPASLTPQVKANLIRTILLRDHGGTWVDATLLPTIPLANWLDPIMAKQDFFAFRSEGDPDLVLQNWFLASRQGSTIISLWAKYYIDYFREARRLYRRNGILASGLRLTHYLAARQQYKIGQMTWFVDPKGGRKITFYPYAAHNYQLSHLLKQNKELRQLWDSGVSHWSVLPRLIGQMARDRDTPTSHFIEMAIEVLPHAPVHKLNHSDPRFQEIIKASKIL